MEKYVYLSGPHTIFKLKLLRGNNCITKGGFMNDNYNLLCNLKIANDVTIATK